MTKQSSIARLHASVLRPVLALLAWALLQTSAQSLLASSPAAVPGSEAPVRPRVWGIARVVYEVGDATEARRFFGDFLGYGVAFEYDASRGRCQAYKVNDTQFVECVVTASARAERPLVRWSLDTDDVEGMRRHLASRGLAVPAAAGADEAGNRVLRVDGPEGIEMEFVQFSETSPHAKARAVPAAAGRVGTRIHHVGIAVTDAAAARRFFVEALGCEEFWRAEPDGAQVNYVYYRLPDCAEYVEIMIGTAKPGRPNAHPCLLVADMQEAVQSLRLRADGLRVRKPTIGKGRRWLLQIESRGGIPVELTELHTAR